MSPQQKPSSFFCICLISVLFVFISRTTTAQVGTGFFNAAVYDNFSSTTAGQAAGINFTIAYSGTYSVNVINAQYTPGNMPPNTGFPASLPLTHELMSNAANNYVQYNFTSDLPQYMAVFLQDVDYSEQVRLEFLNASNDLINTSNIVYRSISAGSMSAVTFNATNILIGGSPDAYDEPLMGFIINTNTVQRVRVTQISGSGVGSYQVFFALLNTDHGDAPSGYGDALHLPTTHLYLGTSVPDAELTAAYSSDATGDNAAVSSTVINDEDGVSSFPVLSVSSTSYSVNVTLRNITGTDATLYGFIDFNRNGNFSDAGEAAGPVTIANGATTATVNWPGISGLVAGNSFARFRISSVASEAGDPAGNAASGEVEDYQVTINAVLPLTWQDISAFQKEESVLVQWLTLNEVNNNFFDIEWSDNGLFFSTIGRYEPAGTNADVQYFYSFLHNRPVAGANFYRIRQVDKDGRYSYSPIRKVNFDAGNRRGLKLYPNPLDLNQEFTLEVKSPVKELYLRIVNANGQVVYTNSFNNVMSKIKISVANLSRGVYYVHSFANGVEGDVIKLIVR